MFYGGRSPQGPMPRPLTLIFLLSSTRAPDRKPVLRNLNYVGNACQYPRTDSSLLIFNIPLFYFSIPQQNPLLLSKDRPHKLVLGRTSSTAQPQNHSTAWAGRDLKAQPVPALATGRDAFHQDQAAQSPIQPAHRLPRAKSRLLLSDTIVTTQGKLE